MEKKGAEDEADGSPVRAVVGRNESKGSVPEENASSEADAVVRGVPQEACVAEEGMGLILFSCCLKAAHQSSGPSAVETTHSTLHSVPTTCSADDSHLICCGEHEKCAEQIAETDSRSSGTRRRIIPMLGLE